MPKDTIVEHFKILTLDYKHTHRHHVHMDTEQIYISLDVTMITSQCVFIKHGIQKWRISWMKSDVYTSNLSNISQRRFTDIFYDIFRSVTEIYWYFIDISFSMRPNILRTGVQHIIIFYLRNVSTSSSKRESYL